MCVVYACSMFSSSLFPSLFSRLYYVNSHLHPTAINEPGVQTECDGCLADLTHSIRIKCADPACAVGDGVDLCPNCFCSGKEFGKHKRGHAYRIEVSKFCCSPLAMRLTIPGLQRSSIPIQYSLRTGALTSDFSPSNYGRCGYSCLFQGTLTS